MTEPLDIAVGVLIDPTGRLLIARRRADVPGAGYWEFPGGKQERDESIFDCLSRELAEEIGVTDLRGSPLIRFAHNRGPRPVRLHVWRVADWTGTPGGREGQEIEWARVDELDDYELLPATDVILTALALPRRYLITPEIGEYGDRTAWLEALDNAVRRGVRLIRVRDATLADADYQRIAADVIARFDGEDVGILLDRDAAMVAELGAHGLHWPARRVAETLERPVDNEHWFAVSAHSAEEIDRAVAAGADFVTLSPVAATATHPEASPLGWPGFETRRGDAPLPVYALGGLAAADLKDAIAHNAHGIAAIRGFGLGRERR